MDEEPEKLSALQYVARELAERVGPLSVAHYEASLRRLLERLDDAARTAIENDQADMVDKAQDFMTYSQLLSYFGRVLNIIDELQPLEADLPLGPEDIN